MQDNQNVTPISARSICPFVTELPAPHCVAQRTSSNLFIMPRKVYHRFFCVFDGSTFRSSLAFVWSEFGVCNIVRNIIHILLGGSGMSSWPSLIQFIPNAACSAETHDGDGRSFLAGSRNTCTPLAVLPGAFQFESA